MSGQFDCYPVSAETVWGIANAVAEPAGDVERLGDDVHGAHRPAQLGVAGLLAHPMISAEQPIQQRVDKWLRSVVFAGGVIRYFGDEVYEYDRGIDDLNRRWQEALGDRFGVPPPDTSGASGPQEEADLLDSYGSQVWIARQEIWRQLERERVVRLESTLDEAADAVARMLDAGPADDGSVLALYQAGVLPPAAPAVFTGVNFSSVDQEELYRNLLSSGRIPDLAALTDEELDGWLRNHPDQAEQLRVVLGLTGPLTPEQDRVARALGRLTASEVTRGLDTEPGQFGLDQIESGSRLVDEINARYAETGAMTAAERAYLEAWYDAIGAEGLAALPAYVDAASHARNPGLSHPAATSSSLEADREHYLSPVADGIMNLSQEAGSLANMPQAIQDLANTEIGLLADGHVVDQHRWHALDPDGRPIWDDFTVAGLDQYGGFVSLLEASTVEGSTEFTRELGESALRVKQDLNAVSANVSHSLWASQEDAAAHQALQLATHDDAVSRMLSVVARNDDAASAMLINDDNRPLLLGLNWYDDAGVVDIIHAGTSRDAAGDGRPQAAATLALIQEVGGDRDFYLERMTDAIGSAVVDTGITWLDMLALPAADGGSSSPGDVRDIFGDDVVGFQLSTADRHDFLSFIAGTDETEVMRFRGASVAYSEQLVVRALQTGEPTRVEVALNAAGTLDGAITRADFSYLADQLGAEFDDAQAAHEAEIRRRNGHALAARMALGALSGAGGPVGAFVGGVSPVMDELIAQVLALDPPPADRTPDTLHELFDGDRLNQSWERHYLLLSAYEGAGISSQPDFPELYDAHGNLRPFDELATDDRSASRLRDLLEAEARARASWEQEKGGGGRLDPSYYTEARNELHHSEAYQPYAPRGSWTDEATARQRLYGEEYVGDSSAGSRAGRIVTTDPDHYYQPRGAE